MAEGIDISLFDGDDEGGTGGGGSSDALDNISDNTLDLVAIAEVISDTLAQILGYIQTGMKGGSGGEGTEAIGAAAGGGKGLGGMFSSALGKASVYLAVFNQAVQGVQRAFGMLQSALARFADVNAVVAIAFERLQLFLRGVLVIMSEALAPVLNQLADVFKELITLAVSLFVEIFTLIRPALMEFLSGIKVIVQWLNRLQGISPMNIEEQGLRRSATGVANVLAQFAGAAQNPQGQPAVNVNIMGNDEADFEGLMNDAVAWGQGFARGDGGGKGFWGAVGGQLSKPSTIAMGLGGPWAAPFAFTGQLLGY